METLHYSGGADELETGKYTIGEYPVLSMRVVNTRKSQLCDTHLRVLLLRRGQEGSGAHRLQELDFDINAQVGRVRGVDFSRPYLPLPWTITHTLNPTSPLYGLQPDSSEDFEIIIVLDGIDEGVSMNIQARWSYIPNEIIWNARFEEMVNFNTARGLYEVDFSKIDLWTPTINPGIQ